MQQSMNDLLAKLTTKKQRLDALRPLPSELSKNLDEWYKIELTYTSNAIEGNTLTRAETALVVEKDITVQGKTLTEHLEAKNHAQAVDFK
jgi:Fic family protein